MKEFQSDCGLNEDWELIIDDDSSELGDSAFNNVEHANYFLDHNETDINLRTLSHNSRKQ